MAKQKFYCKGVVRKTGQRVAITVTADSKELAVKIAEQHDVKVESIALVADGAAEPPKPAAKPAPAQPKPPANAAPIQPKPAANSTPAAPKVAPKVINARLDEILDAEDEADDGLDDFDLGEEASNAPAASDAPTTKACPYCGEQILAVAVKCKHCGSYVGETVAKPRLATAVAEPMPTVARRGTSKRVWAIVGGVAALVLVVIVAVALWVHSLLTSTVAAILPTEPVAPAAPSAPAAPPKVEPQKASSEELAYAEKLVAFLDSCDELTRMLEKGAKPDQCSKQCETIKANQKAIPQPPQGVAWARQSYDSSSQLVPVLDAAASRGAESDLVGELLKQTAGAAPDTSQVYRQLAEQIRKLVAAIRSQIPPACLPKPK